MPFVLIHQVIGGDVAGTVEEAEEGGHDGVALSLHDRRGVARERRFRLQ